MTPLMYKFYRFFIMYWFIISPFIIVISVSLPLLTFKQDLQKAGKILIPVAGNDNFKPTMFSKIYSIFAIIFGFLLLYLNLIWGYAAIFLGLSFLLQNLSNTRYYKVNGIYENALIHNSNIFFYKKLHAWETKDSNAMTLHTKDGNQIDFNAPFPTEDLKKQLEKQNVSILKASLK